MKVKNLGAKAIHIIISSGAFIVPFEGVFECTEKEYSMLKHCFKLGIIEEEPVVETKPVIVEEVVVEEKVEPVKKVTKAKPKSKKKK